MERVFLEHQPCEIKGSFLRQKGDWKVHVLHYRHRGPRQNPKAQKTGRVPEKPRIDPEHVDQGGKSGLEREAHFNGFGRPGELPRLQGHKLGQLSQVIGNVADSDSEPSQEETGEVHPESQANRLIEIQIRLVSADEKCFGKIDRGPREGVLEAEDRVLQGRRQVLGPEEGRRGRADPKDQLERVGREHVQDVSKPELVGGFGGQGVGFVLGEVWGKRGVRTRVLFGRSADPDAQDADGQECAFAEGEQ